MELERTARLVYLVVEFDISEYARDGTTPSEWAPLVREWRERSITVADACAALHWHLSTHLPLAAVVHSGGKSLHGWFYGFEKTETELRHFVAFGVGLWGYLLREVGTKRPRARNVETSWKGTANTSCEKSLRMFWKISIQKKLRVEPELARYTKKCTRFPPTIRTERRGWSEFKPLPALSEHLIK